MVFNHNRNRAAAVNFSWIISRGFNIYGLSGDKTRLASQDGLAMSAEEEHKPDAQPMKADAPGSAPSPASSAIPKKVSSAV